MSLDYSKALIPITSRSTVKQSARIILGYDNQGVAALFDIYEAVLRRFDPDASKGSDSYFSVSEFRTYLHELKLRYPQIYQGYQGTQGLQGTVGTNGPQGFQGYQGRAGTGTRGYQGYQGYQGKRGAQGPQGAQGTQGPTGADGITWSVVKKLLNDHGFTLENGEFVFSKGTFTQTVSAAQGLYQR